MRISIGILGLGPAGLAMLPFIKAHPDFRLAALCDSRAEALAPYDGPDDLFRSTRLEDLLARPDLDAIFVATPTWLHGEHAVAILKAGKHAIVEKPMALDLREADAMVDAARTKDRILLIGHSQSFEPAIQIMRAVIASGRLGALRAVNGWNFTDWMYRPRLPIEYERSKGGGVVYRQAAHHVDILRYLVGASPAEVTATVGDWDPSRPGDGAYTALLRFPGGITGSLFYSGYDHFASSELTFGIGENGGTQPQVAGEMRRRLLGRQEDDSPKYGNAMSTTMARLEPGAGPAFFGIVVASCERGDMRLCPEGVRVYGDEGEMTIPVAGLPRGRRAVLDEFADGIKGKRCTHDGAWGRANLATCLAMLESSDMGRPATCTFRDTSTLHLPDLVVERVAETWQ